MEVNPQSIQRTWGSFVFFDTSFLNIKNLQPSFLRYFRKVFPLLWLSYLLQDQDLVQ